MIFKILFLSLMSFAGNANAETSFENAQKALAAIGADVQGSSKKCSSCHSLSSGTFKKWGADTLKTSQCLSSWSNLNPREKSRDQALKALECLGYGDSPALGLFSAHFDDQRWSEIFTEAFEDGVRKFKIFRSELEMPRDGSGGFAAADWESISRWVEEGLPHLDILLNEGEVPDLQCRPFISSELLSHIQKRQSSSWKSKNQDAQLINWSCPNNEDSSNCFEQRRSGVDTFPEHTDISASSEWTIRKVLAMNRPTSYWMRVSPDGRFIATGLNGAADLDGESYSSAVYDLSGLLRPDGEAREILVDASYDPSFFPDQSGFIFQSPNMICPVSLLKRSDIRAIDSRSEGCAGGDMSLYHSAGSSLEGGRHLAFSGQFLADEGHGSYEDYPWSTNSDFRFQIFEFDGQAFTSKDSFSVPVKGMGDGILSPSSDLILSRVIGKEGNKSEQVGFRLDKVQWNSASSASIHPVGMICGKGAKGFFSFDERFVTYHRYNGTASDVFVTDLLTNETYQVTDVGGGKRALYPNFRSDGWLYFLVKGGSSSGPEVFVSDVILRLAEKQPYYLGVTK